MRCYKCGCVLSANDTCAKCGTDVSIYKKTARVSDIYYNKGLEKARVRDLSGAIETLKVSLMINKYNINARNLLGLIYCEMGEVVEALSQWVMSKNLAPDDNVAESYIKKIQSNQNKFESVTNAIKKYNVSLQYAKDKSTDMAVIQLKKIVISNPHFIKAHLLLALIYIKDNEYQRARKLLNSVLKIDRNNTLASKYLEQINQSQNIKDNDISGSFLPKKKVKEEESKPLNGNDVILPRSSYKEPSNGAITIVNVLVGVVIGAALIWFLVMPSRYKGITEDYNRSLAEYSEQLSSGNVELNSMESELKTVKAEKESLEQQLSELNGTGGGNKLLISVIESANAYIANKRTEAAEKLIDVDVSALPSDSAKTLYNTISTAVMAQAANEFYSKAQTSYYKSDYATAVDDYVKAFKCDATKVDAAYYAAKCYVALSQTDNAKKYYQYIVNDFKTSGYYKEANDYVTSH